MCQMPVFTNILIDTVQKTCIGPGQLLKWQQSNILLSVIHVNEWENLSLLQTKSLLNKKKYFNTTNLIYRVNNM